MLTLLSPAKLNLFLRIVRRRPDGYHDLASLFQTVSLADTLHFSLSERDQLTCTDPALPTDHTNLVLKAVDLFRKKTGLSFGLKIHLEKHIPYQSGLGGGSSNAATTLWALNQLTEQCINDVTLSQWASEIGSDISFFFSQGTAYCTGRGENVQSVSPLPSTALWIAKPPIGLSTPAVFQRVKVDQLPAWDPEHALQQFLTGSHNYINDLEHAAFALMPELADFKRQLQQLGFHSTLMTGSGSAFFCLGHPKHPLPSSIFCQQASFINRTPHRWYENE
jgi:4-diphosphocytidyl-2-C-methyl-D-erythritol kinase